MRLLRAYVHKGVYAYSQEAGTGCLGDFAHFNKNIC